MHTNTHALASQPLRRWASFSALLAPALRGHAILFVLLAFHLAGAAVVTAMTPGLSAPSLIPTLMTLLIFLPLSILSLRFFHLATRVRPEHPITALARDMGDFLRQPDRMANGLVITFVFVIFMNVFSYLKGAIPVIHPFSWDTTFMEWDRWLHGGYHPWELLQPLFGYPPVTFVINMTYHLWFMVIWLMVAGLAFTPVPSELRTRFFLAFMATWGIGGNLLATVFSSAGPCYYSLIGLAPDPFAPLLSYLNTANEVLPVWALNTQLLLWQGYQGDAIKLGISAMPSIHNAAALLCALAGWHINRKLGAVLFVFTGLILLGSVHLGWHYAIDGYAGLVLALIVWWLAGFAARAWEATSWARGYAEAVARLGASRR